ncbi:MAG: UDP-glucose/GDP-mannose dehydrogenase family protein [archaeon]|nr:UDP-glucose/GDP-mannose dehydrogenase family protein [archaeon]MCP8321061.1 UDP-glucose/GDP-mannose dehydrogenase family protein [archaeon]
MTVELTKISILGLGYVGLSHAVCYANKGFQVIGVDVDQEKVDAIKKGKPTFYEPKLKEFLEMALENNSLHCTTEFKDAIIDSEVSFVTVGTPSKPDGGIDLRFIKSASRNLGLALKEKSIYHLIVVRSTVIPGTTQNFVKPIIEKISGKECGKDFGLCVNPEFLREGSAIEDMIKPDRIIVGEHDKRAGDSLEGILRKFCDEIPFMIRTSLSTAELIKYANNAFLATKISFINTIANICENTPGTDVKVVAEGIGIDPRIGSLFLRAGLGYGGSCLPKDVKAIINYSKQAGYEPILLEAVDNVNELQPQVAIKMAKKLIGEIKGKRIAILGLAFKPNTDDMREAVSIKIINHLIREGCSIVVHDPMAMDNARRMLGDKVRYARSIHNCIKDADCCIIVTEWDSYKQLKPKDFIRYMKEPAIVDGRRVYDPKEFLDQVRYVAVGLGAKQD